MILDLFNEKLGVSESKWHPKVKLLNSPQFIDEKRILLNWTKGFVDRDNKIIKEFQTTFHSSFWEFYLHTLFKEMGFCIDYSKQAPDFIITSPQPIAIEAVTANIKEKGRSESTRGMSDILSMVTPPIAQSDFYNDLDESITRMSTAFLSKHFKYKEYLKHDGLSESTPFVIAACSYDQVNYGREFIYAAMGVLYGMYYDARKDSYNFKEHITKPGTKSQIPIGLFWNKDYSNISAVIYSSTITLGKLTAMHISQCGLSTNTVYQLWKDSNDPIVPYKLQVITPEQPELLSEGVFIFHNPNAKNKLPQNLFKKDGIVQYQFDGKDLFHDGYAGEVVSRLNLATPIANIAFPYIMQQMDLYNKFDIFETNNPQNKEIDFNIHCSVFMIVEAPDGSISAMNHEEKISLSDNEIRQKTLKSFYDTQNDIPGIEFKLKDILIARNRPDFEETLSKYNVIDMSMHHQIQ